LTPAGDRGIIREENRRADMKVQVIIHEAEEGGFWAEVPALPGCFSQGQTLDEVRANIREAAEGWLEAGADVEPNERHPSDRVEEIEL
jgi:predicted RNase H-like HicB family nuclease